MSHSFIVLDSKRISLNQVYCHIDKRAAPSRDASCCQHSRYTRCAVGPCSYADNLFRLTEPTVIPPVVLELCSVAILHRFASPAWFEHIRKHVPADLSSMDAFVRIVQLQVILSVLLPILF